MKKKLFLYIGMTAVVIAACKTTRTPQKDIIPPKMESGKILSWLPHDSGNSKKYYQTLVAGVQKDTILPGKIESSSEPFEQTHIIPAVSNKTFYIVAGSFKKYKNALFLGQVLREKGFQNVTCQFGNGYNRVVAEQFSSESTARNFLHDFRRKYPGFQDAWLLIKE